MCVDYLTAERATISDNKFSPILLNLFFVDFPIIFRTKFSTAVLFSGGSRIFPRGCANSQKCYYFSLFFAENCMEMKEFGPPDWACIPGATWICQCYSWPIHPKLVPEANILKAGKLLHHTRLKKALFHNSAHFHFKKKTKYK